MSWPSVINSVSYYAVFCFGTLFYFIWVPLNALIGFLLVILAPATHLATYAAHGSLIPIYFLSKFETLYIYLGVAALIGVFTGSLLHFSSKMLTKAFNLQASPEIVGRTAASVRAARAAREKRGLEDAWQASAPIRNNQARVRVEEISKDYSEYIEKGRGKRKEGQSLLSQIILEEDDDSEDGFYLQRTTRVRL